VNRPYLAFPKTDRHLHEQFLLQPEWQPARCRFEHVDPTPRQNAEQGFGLHVTGRERIREEPDEIDILWPACVAMFTEEVGVSPTIGDGGASYRARLEQLIRSGRAFARIEDGEV